MNASEKRQDFLAKLNKLIEDFEKENPDVSMKYVDILFTRKSDGRDFYLGTRKDAVDNG